MPIGCIFEVFLHITSLIACFLYASLRKDEVFKITQHLLFFIIKSVEK